VWGVRVERGAGSRKSRALQRTSQSCLLPKRGLVQSRYGSSRQLVREGLPRRPSRTEALRALSQGRLRRSWSRLPIDPWKQLLGHSRSVNRCGSLLCESAHKPAAAGVQCEGSMVQGEGVEIWKHAHLQLLICLREVLDIRVELPNLISQRARPVFIYH